MKMTPREHHLSAVLRKLVEVYREGQENPEDEPQCIWEAIQALNEYDAAWWSSGLKRRHVKKVVMKEGCEL
jgi:hypothetical protein